MLPKLSNDEKIKREEMWALTYLCLKTAKNLTPEIHRVKNRDKLQGLTIDPWVTHRVLQKIHENPQSVFSYMLDDVMKMSDLTGIDFNYNLLTAKLGEIMNAWDIDTFMSTEPLTGVFDLSLLRFQDYIINYCIQLRRFNLKISKAKFVEAMDVTEKAVYNWEHGQASPNIENRKKIFEILQYDKELLPYLH